MFTQEDLDVLNSMTDDYLMANAEVRMEKWTMMEINNPNERDKVDLNPMLINAILEDYEDLPMRINEYHPIVLLVIKWRLKIGR